MTKTLVLLAVFASVILLVHVIPVHAKYSEAREKAKEREKQIISEQEKKIKDKRIQDLNDQKKALDSITIKKPIDPKGKAAAESTNTARLKVLNDAKAAYDAAKTALESAKSALRADSSSATKQTAYNDAKKAFEKAKIDRELAKLSLK